METSERLNEGQWKVMEASTNDESQLQSQRGRRGAPAGAAGGDARALAWRSFTASSGGQERGGGTAIGCSGSGGWVGDL